MSAKYTHHPVILVDSDTHARLRAAADARHTSMDALINAMLDEAEHVRRKPVRPRACDCWVISEQLPDGEHLPFCPMRARK